jgi:hypothetical protein
MTKNHQKSDKYFQFSPTKGLKENKYSSKVLYWAAKIFALIFGGPLCFQRREPMLCMKFSHYYL